MNTTSMIVVFDLMATLHNREREHFYAFALACFTILDIATTPEKILSSISGLVGGGDEFVARSILTYFGRDEEMLQALLQCKREYFASMPPPHPTRVAQSGSFRAIRWLKDQGHPLAICSNTPRKVAMPIIEEIGIADLIPIKHMVFAGGNIRKKPEPDGLIEVARRLKVSVRDLVLFGDAEYDGMAANAAGAQWVAVPTFPGIPSVMKGLLAQNPVDIITNWENVDLSALMKKVQNRA